MLRAVLACALVASVVAAAGTERTLSMAVDEISGGYSLRVSGKRWYSSSGPPTLCVRGAQTVLSLSGIKPSSDSEIFGAWTGTTATFSAGDATMQLTFKSYSSQPHVLVGTTSLPNSVDTTGCSGNTDLSTHLLEFSTSLAYAADLHTLSWRGGVIATTATAKGLGKLGASGLDCGLVVSTDPLTRNTLVISTLDHHKIVPQKNINSSWSMGIAGAIPSLPAGFNHSVLFTFAAGGASGGVYA